MDIRSDEQMRKIISNFNSNDVQTMLNLLQYTDTETEKRWSDTYIDQIKY